MTDEELAQYAATLVLDAAHDIEYLTVFEAAGDTLGHEISEEDGRKVMDLIEKASVSVVVGGLAYGDENGPVS